MKYYVFFIFIVFLIMNLIYAQTDEIILSAGESKTIKFDNNISKISIGNPKIADVRSLSGKEILVNGKKSGSTSLIIWINNSKITKKIIVTSYDIDLLQKEVEELLKNVKGISISVKAGKVTLEGEVLNQKDLPVVENVLDQYNEKINNLIKLPVQMIKINARVVEISESSDATIGIDWRTKFQFTEDTIKGITSIGKISRQTRVDAMLDFLVKEGNAKIVARPNIIVMNGKSAVFHSGGKVLIPVLSGDNLSIEEKTYGVNLNILPYGDRKSNLIKTRVKMEVSTLDWENGIKYSGGTIPAIRDRIIDTEIDIKLGKTIVIAGLLMEEEAEISNKVPILGYIPLLSYLFSSTETITYKTELVVFLTPSFVNFFGEEIIN